MSRGGRGDANRRNTLVHLEQNVPTVDSNGQAVASWSRKWSRYAEVLTRGGRERRIWEQMGEEIDYLVRLPWDSQTGQLRGADWRVVWFDGVANRTANISSAIDLDNRHETMELRATEAR